MWETWVRSLGWEDPLEKGTSTHSTILAWRIPLSLQVEKNKDITTDLTLEKAMAPHSSTLAWKIPWTEEPDRLQSMALQSRT